MNSTNTNLLRAAAAGACLAAVSAQAMPVTPNVTGATAIAITSGQVPDPDPSNFLGALTANSLDVQIDLPATAAAGVSSIPSGGAETTDGAAQADIDLADFFGGSEYRARSEVFTAPPPATPTGPTGVGPDQFNMLNQSLAAIVAALDTIGLVGQGEEATVDAVLNVSGSLIYQDPTGVAGAPLVEFLPGEFEIAPDMQASVSLQFLVADLLGSPPVDPDNPPVDALFNGSATLASIDGIGAPVLSVEGDLDLTDFNQIGACDQFFCQYDIDTSFSYTDILGTLGFGDTFEAGFLMLTSVDGLSHNAGSAGRRLVSNFYDTGSFDVILQVESSDVPEPGTLIMLTLGLAALGASVRCRRDAPHPTA